MPTDSPLYADKSPTTNFMKRYIGRKLFTTTIGISLPITNETGGVGIYALQ